MIKKFEDLSKNDISIAGGKGASLGEMRRAGIPVPGGFVILVEAFDKFLEETDLVQEIAAILAKINYKDINSVERASNIIRDLFHDAAMPEDLEKEFIKEFKALKSKYVAVRSSATAEDSAVASWAGELETYLNTTEEMFFENIKKCWSSLFTPRALFYAFEKKLITVDHQKKIRAKTCKKLCDCYPVCVAVVVQKMIQSEVSGICFTVHPVTENRNQMVIEAGWGLGEAIVGGKITPDTYIIQKSKIKNQNDNSKFKILDKNISEQGMMIVRSAKGTEEIAVPKVKRGKQKLTDRQIFALAKICLKIENHYAAPQDIEWAMEKNKFYIVQSRPITTL
jgi:pyruvate,water dikinase